MSFLNPRECTDEQIMAFWTWFEKNEGKLTERDGSKRTHALRETQQQVKELFPACPDAVNVTTMPDGDRWALYLSYGGRPYAKKSACRIRVLMPALLQGKWSMEVSK